MKREMLSAILVLLGLIGYTQEDALTDEELRTYASVMVWAEKEQDILSNVVSDSVAGWIADTELTSSRYNELRKADKRGTLESVEATEGELSIYNDIQARIDEQKEDFKSRYTNKILEDIGGALYKEVKTALKSDEEVKSRYQAIYDELLTAQQDASSTEGESSAE